MKRFTALFLSIVMILSVMLSSVSCDEFLNELLEDPNAAESEDESTSKTPTKETQDGKTEKVTKEDAEAESEDINIPDISLPKETTEYDTEAPTEYDTEPPVEHTCRDKSPYDHYCDECGATMSECMDKNNDHRCDICNMTLSDCYDYNGDSSCDMCGKSCVVTSISTDKTVYSEGEFIYVSASHKEAALIGIAPAGTTDWLGYYEMGTAEGFADIPVGKYDIVIADMSVNILKSVTVEVTESDRTLTIPQAINIGLSMDHSVYTTDKYYVTGTVKEIQNETYGNVYIVDEYGNEFYIYGLYSADGNVRFDKLEEKPVVGDVITVYGVIGRYSNTPQMRNAWIVEHIQIEMPEPDPEPEPTPDPNRVFTIPEALELNDGANVKASGTVVEINTAWSEAYGNMSVTIADEKGNQLYVYRTKTQVNIGDIITVTGVMGSYGGKKLITQGSTAVIDVKAEIPESEPPVIKGNSADFNTIELPMGKINGDSSYGNFYSTAKGWATENSAIQCGGEQIMNPQFPVIGPDNTYKAVCLNGKTTAPGKITSPVISGGIDKLTINYTKIFSDTNLSVTVTLTELSTGNVYTHVISAELPKDEKYVVYTDEWVLEDYISGDFTIEIINNCPSQTTFNKDRMTIISIEW